MRALNSPHSAGDTMGRLKEAVKQRGPSVFARIDHAAGAAKVGMTLRPIELLIFGNPQGGTPLTVCEQTAGIDLTLKALVWQEAAAQIWVGYNDPAYLAQRHGVHGCAVVENLRKVLVALAEASLARRSQRVRVRLARVDAASPLCSTPGNACHRPGGGRQP